VVITRHPARDTRAQRRRRRVQHSVPRALARSGRGERATPKDHRRARVRAISPTPSREERGESGHGSPTYTKETTGGLCADGGGCCRSVSTTPGSFATRRRRESPTRSRTQRPILTVGRTLDPGPSRTDERIDVQTSRPGMRRQDVARDSTSVRSELEVPVKFAAPRQAGRHKSVPYVRTLRGRTSSRAESRGGCGRRMRDTSGPTASGRPHDLNVRRRTLQAPDRGDDLEGVPMRHDHVARIDAHRRAGQGGVGAFRSQRSAHRPTELLEKTAVIAVRRSRSCCSSQD